MGIKDIDMYGPGIQETMNSRKIATASKLSTPITFYDRHCDGKSEINNYRIDCLPYDVYCKVIRHTMGSHGCMQNLTKTKYNEWSEDGWVSVCTNEHDDVLGWGLVYKLPLIFKRKCDFHVYVRKQHRRRHVGSDILVQCNLIAKQYFRLPIQVSPHDTSSRCFFVENKIPPLNWGPVSYGN